MQNIVCHVWQSLQVVRSEEWCIVDRLVFFLKVSMSDTQTPIPSGDDLAAQALGQDPTPSQPEVSADDEAAQSDQVAQALGSLQNVIERNATELQRIANELKEKREMMKNVFENDVELATAEEQVSLVTNQVKERKAKLQGDPQITTLKVQIGELNEQKKEIEETLSNHLVNYYQMTNSTSFDTSDGDQWEFKVSARVKPRKQAA